VSKNRFRIYHIVKRKLL